MPDSTNDTFCMGKHFYDDIGGPLINCSEGKCAPKPSGLLAIETYGSNRESSTKATEKDLRAKLKALIEKNKRDRAILRGRHLSSYQEGVVDAVNDMLDELEEILND